MNLRSLPEPSRAHLERILAAVSRADSVDSWPGNGFLARLALGDLEGAARGLRAMIAACKRGAGLDCVDFRLNLLFRAHELFGDRWPPELRTDFQAVALDTPYFGVWSPEYPAYRNSENHHLNWAVAEYLAAQTFPDATFAFDQHSAAQHQARSRLLIANWIDLRARYGFCEWNSATYMGINVLSLLNLADFAREPALRALASRAVTMLLADLAAEAHHGFVIGAQARLYADDLIRGRQLVSSAMTLLLGAGDSGEILPRAGLDECVATTGYRPPEALRAMAGAGSAGVHRERHRAETDLLYSCRSAFWHPPVELIEERARRRFAPHSLPEVGIRTEQNSDWMISGAHFSPRDRKDHPAPCPQGLVWSGCLAGHAPVFATHPFAGDSKRARDRFWTGTASLPVCLAMDGVVAALYSGGPQGADFTHAYFPTAQLEEWHQDGQVFYGRRARGCAALFAPPDARLVAQGDHAGVEIRAPGARAAWLMVLGSTAAEGSFSNFVERCRAFTLRHAPESGRLEVLQPSARWILNANGEIAINDVPFSFADWPRMDHPAVHADFGEAVWRFADAAERLEFHEARALVRDNESLLLATPPPFSNPTTPLPV